MFNARRSKSCQRPTRAASADYYNSNNNNGQHGNNNEDEDMDMGDLRETIAHLKESVMTHANSSAETMEHFVTLQKAHDTLYGDYTRLQEQMDDAVELLKYLKEDKSNYESKVGDMTAELEVLRKESKNIAALNAENSELSAKIDALEKSNHEARASQTKQQLEYETTLSNFLKERGELLDKVKVLEQESTTRETKQVEDLNNKLATSLEKIAQLQRERRILSLSQTNDSSTHALMEKMNERIEHLERDNRELLQETKDMKLYVTSMEEALVKKDKQSEATENEFQNEKEELQQHLVSFQEQISGYQQQQESLQKQIQKYQQQDQSRQTQLLQYQQLEERHNEIMLESESLKHQIQELQNVVEEQSNASRQYPAHLEKEMQERLAQRIAVQLQDSKLSMEAQIREELESEYLVKQQEIISSYESRNVSNLESKLREELLQVKDERERWKSEQEDLMKKVRDSQQQFEIVREGFKKKLEKEKNRCRELEKEKEGQEIVIEKLSEEYHDAMNEVSKLQAQGEAHRQSLEELSRQQLEKEKSSLVHQHQRQLEDSIRREEEFTLQIRKLQNEIEELLNEQTAHVHERNRWEEEKQSLLAKCSEKDDEIRRAMDDLEELNSENADYLQKIEVYTNSMDSFEESRVKYSVLQIEHKQVIQKLTKQEELNESLTRQLEQLNAENGDLQQRTTELTLNLNSMHRERDTLQQSLKESSEMCSKIQSELLSVRKDDDDQNDLPPSSAPAAGFGVVGRENAVKDTLEIESRHKKIVDEMQARISDSTTQISKLIDQLSIFSSEKASLTTKLESVTLELSIMKEKAESQASETSQLKASVELLTAERDAATSLLAEGNLALSSLSSEKLELMSVIDEKWKELVSVEAEKAQALANVGNLKDSVRELQDKTECLEAELDSSKSEISKLMSQIGLANQQPIEDERICDAPACMLDSNTPNVIEDYEEKIRALRSEIEQLKVEREKSTIQAEDINTSPRSTNEEVQKLNIELTELRESNAALQEAIQDIQVEKEDFEQENEELASKLADLTTQAKMMLLNNESLEEAIQDQQIEYEERIAELEGLLAEKYENDDQLLQSQAEKDVLSGRESNGAYDGAHLTQDKDLNLEVGQVIDRSSKSDPGNIMAKPVVITSDATSVTTGNSQPDDEEIARKEIATTHSPTTEAQFDRLQSLNHDCDDTPNHVEVEMQHYTPIDRNVARSTHAFDQSSELMERSERIQNSTILSAAAISPGALMTLPTFPVTTTNEQMIFMPAETKAIVQYHEDARSAQGMMMGGIEDQVKKLIVENGKLAQRLGNAVADKEFAMNTLSQLGAKMEELMERNRKLSNLAGFKCNNQSHGSSYYSFGLSMKSQSVHNHSGIRSSNMGRGRDPVEVNNNNSNNNNSSSFNNNNNNNNNNTTAVSCSDSIEPSYFPAPSDHDDQSAYSFSGSTILTYESLKQLEPESSYSIADRGVDIIGLKQRHSFGREGQSRSVAKHSNELSNEISSRETHRVKFPGGEYSGCLNRRGQKHGYGKMKYDNGNEYEGEWINDKRAGKGTTKYSSGNVYIGAWKAGKRHGFGVFHIKKTGDVYRGNWANGLKSGPGGYEYEDGELDISFYKDDMRVGEGVRWSASRHQASRLVDGQLVGEEGGMPFEEATRLTKQLGFIV